MKYILILLTLLLSFLWAEDYKTIQRHIYKKMKIEPKVALVIGNEAYKKDKLHRTISDANNTKNFLESKGFKVIYAQNVKTKGAMKKLVNQFVNTIKKNGVGLFYFSGHGISAYNKNYILPIENESIFDDTDIEDIGMSINYLLEKLENKKNRLNIVILDACRNSLGKGSSMPLLSNDASGVYIAYATSMGTKARDNGVFTSSFIKNASIAGLKIEEVFKRVRVDVRKNSKGEQIPLEHNQIEGDFFFVLPKDASSMGNVVYNESKQDNSFLWWSLGGLLIILVFLLFLLFKLKEKKIVGNSSTDVGDEESSPYPSPEPKNEIKGTIKMNNLIYQNQPFTQQYSWQKAKEYASNLRLGGFDDWRLPTLKELRDLGNLELYGEEDVFWNEWYQKNKDYALVNSKGEKHFVHEKLIENMPKESIFWTAEAKDEDDIWVVAFHLGCDNVEYDEDKHYVLCVRDNK